MVALGRQSDTVQCVRPALEINAPFNWLNDYIINNDRFVLQAHVVRVEMSVSLEVVVQFPLIARSNFVVFTLNAYLI